MPSDSVEVGLSLSDDGRTLHARFEGTLEVPGALLQFARDSRHGEARAAAGAGRMPVHLRRGRTARDSRCCTGWSSGSGSHRTRGYVVSADFTGDDGIVAVRRDPATGALAPLDAPGACWGIVTEYGGEPPPLTTGEPCAAVPEWWRTMPFSEPLVTADGRNAYVCPGATTATGRVAARSLMSGRTSSPSSSTSPARSGE